MNKKILVDINLGENKTSIIINTNNIMITKEKSRQRIDGVASLMDAYVIFVNKRQEYLDYINEEV